MRADILVLSSLYDFSTDLVVLSLQEAGVPYIRLNREQFADYRITLDPLVPELIIRSPMETYQIGSDLGAVWFRQPVFLRNTPPIPLSPKEQLERSQWTAFVRGLCVFRQAAWMNSPAATYLAESKPYQLSIAASCGFQVPATRVSNDASCIQKTFPGKLVVKSLDTVLLRDGEDYLFTYTTLSSANELNDGIVHAAPLIAQQVLEEKVDLRVTVVGGKIFAVRILSNGAGIAGDWRVVPKENLDFQSMRLSGDMAERCQMLTQRLGLAFAAIDLIEIPDGTFFVEVNPTGEWGWLSTKERPIDRVIASWLANPPESTPG